MGSLAGHIVPGVFFMIYGGWWILISFWSHLTTASKPQPAKTSRSKIDSGSGSTSYADFKRDSKLSRLSYIPQPFCVKVHLEPFIKIALSLFGIVAEVFFRIDTVTGKFTVEAWSMHETDGSFKELSKFHHLTMYSAFVLSGVVDIVMLFLRLPRHTSKLFLTQAFFVEGILFLFHAWAKDTLNLTAHILLTIAIFSCVVLSGLRMWQSSNLFVNAGLGLSMTLQATWFIQAGLVLFGGAEWDFEDHNNAMFITACFVWHLITITSAMLVLYVIMMSCLRSSVKYRRGRRRAPFRSMLPSIPLYPQNGEDSPERERLIAEEKEMKDLSTSVKGSSEKREEESIA